jgi:hypothetical protein
MDGGQCRGRLHAAEECLALSALRKGDPAMTPSSLKSCQVSRGKNLAGNECIHVRGSDDSLAFYFEYRELDIAEQMAKDLLRMIAAWRAEPGRPHLVRQHEGGES